MSEDVHEEAPKTEDVMEAVETQQPAVAESADTATEGQPPAPEEEVSEEEEAKEKLPFPTACIVRLMKAQMDKEKMIKKDVKIAMNKWLGNLVEKVSKEMNKFPYVMIHRHEFEQSIRPYIDLENFDKEKQRILAHLEAIKQDIQRLERDLGKVEESQLIS